MIHLFVSGSTAHKRKHKGLKDRHNEHKAKKH